MLHEGSVVHLRFHTDLDHFDDFLPRHLLLEAYQSVAGLVYYHMVPVHYPGVHEMKELQHFLSYTLHTHLFDL